MIEKLTIALVVGFIIGLVLEVSPGLAPLWDKWRWKRVTLLALFILVPVVAVVLSCGAGINTGLELACLRYDGGAGDLAWPETIARAILAGLTAFTASQGGYKFAGSGVDIRHKSRVKANGWDGPLTGGRMDGVG